MACAESNGPGRFSDIFDPNTGRVAYHTFGGWKRSAFGNANQHGTKGVRF